MRNLWRVIGLAVLLAGPFSAANAFVIGDSTTLTNWDDSDLNASHDYVQVNSGYYGAGESWFSLQWEPGTANLLQAIGINTVFYNSTDLVGEVWEGAIGTGTNVTTQWTLNYGGSTGGGGFGNFYSQKSLNGGTGQGITEPLFFVLYRTTGFAPNTQGSIFDVQVRYGNQCSGWASDGTSTNVLSGTSCGSSVPEPSSLLLLVPGLLGFGLLVLVRSTFAQRD